MHSETEVNRWVVSRLADLRLHEERMPSHHGQVSTAWGNSNMWCHANVMRKEHNYSVSTCIAILHQWLKEMVVRCLCHSLATIKDANPFSFLFESTEKCDRICEKGPHPAFSRIFRFWAIFKLSYFHNYSWQRSNPWYRTSTNLQLMPSMLDVRSTLHSGGKRFRMQ